MRAKLGDAAKRGPTGWEGNLVGAAEAAGAEVLQDRVVRHEIEWADPPAMWDGMTRAGPWHAKRVRHGDAWVDGLREEWVASFPPAAPIKHTPAARMLVLARRT